jgi:predicted outer membrane protein
VQIDQQINQRCLQMAKDELQQKSGADFDKCYVGNAIGMHVHALAALEVIGKQTQGQLAQVAQQAQPTVQQHFDQAKQLMKQLEGQSTATGTQAQRETKRTE